MHTTTHEATRLTQPDGLFPIHTTGKTAVPATMWYTESRSFGGVVTRKYEAEYFYGEPDGTRWKTYTVEITEAEYYATAAEWTHQITGRDGKSFYQFDLDTAIADAQMHHRKAVLDAADVMYELNAEMDAEIDMWLAGMH